MTFFLKSNFRGLLTPASPANAVRVSRSSPLSDAIDRARLRTETVTHLQWCSRKFGTEGTLGGPVSLPSPPLASPPLPFSPFPSLPSLLSLPCLPLE